MNNKIIKSAADVQNNQTAIAGESQNPSENADAESQQQNNDYSKHVLGVMTKNGFVRFIEIPYDLFLWTDIQESARFYCEKWGATTANPYHGDKGKDLCFSIWTELRYLNDALSGKGKEADDVVF